VRAKCKAIEKCSENREQTRRDDAMMATTRRTYALFQQTHRRHAFAATRANAQLILLVIDALCNCVVATMWRRFDAPGTELSNVMRP
jgi:hypothetical protein